MLYQSARTSPTIAIPKRNPVNMSDHGSLYEDAHESSFSSLGQPNVPPVARANDIPIPSTTSSRSASPKRLDSPMPSPELTPPTQHLLDTFSDYTSLLDSTHGPLRTTSDGNLVEEESGDWLVLATPPHSRSDRDLAIEKCSRADAEKLPAIGLPESKNGATGLDDPRARKSLVRLLKNKWTGSDRLPVEVKKNEEENKQAEAGPVAARALDGERERRTDRALFAAVRNVHDEEMREEMGKFWYERAFFGYLSRQEVLRVVARLDEER